MALLRVWCPRLDNDFVPVSGRSSEGMIRSIALSEDSTPTALTLAGPALDGDLLRASPWQLATKRGVDVIGALIAFLLLSPLFVLAFLGVLISSGSPVFFQQVRVGRYGRPIRILKFRTMHKGADSLMGDYWSRNELDGPIFKMRDDPRVTRVGRLLRKFSIDELPQLVNVVVGDMSLVGPRPLVAEEYATLGPRECQRLLATPGLTGIWQVSGRCDVDFQTWIEMDLDYIRTWSLRRDFGVLLRTIPAVLTGRGSY